MVDTGTAKSWSLRAGLSAVVCLSAIAMATAPALSESWWPFGGNDEPQRAPVPREPVYRPQPVPAPIPQQAPAPQGAANWSTKNPICLQLEQRLVQEGQKGNQTRDQLPKLEAEQREIDRTYNVSSQQLDKSCFEYFLFTKTFKATAQCKDLARQVEVSKRRLGELEAQRQQIMGSAGRSYQDDIVRELARNNCGANYVDQARRREGGVWQDEESAGNNTWTPQNGSGAATYRTLCVRLCDGFYFPVSFSTLPSHFPQDAEVCQAKCAAPTELYYHPNPGGSVDHAVALKSQEPYTRLKVAFRYRKEFVNGCSCKEAEFVPAVAGGEKKADGGASVGTPVAPMRAGPGRKAEALPNADTANITTGSTAKAAPTVPPAAAPAIPAALPKTPTSLPRAPVEPEPIPTQE